MKLFKYGLPFAALALLASCANDNVVDQPDPTPEPGQSAYLNVRISVGDVTRSGQIVDGESYEAAVNSQNPGYLILFSSASNEGDAVCNYIVNLNGWAGTAGSDDVEVTNNYGELKMEGVDKNNYLGLVILNPNGITLPSIGLKFSDWANNPQNFTHEAVTDSKYLTMTSALGWKAAPASVTGEPVVLTPIADTDFYYSSSNKPQNPVTFYVSRIASKVSLQASTSVTVGTAYNVTDSGLTEGTQNGDQATITSWQVDGVNPNAYPVQRIEAGTVKWTSFASDIASDWATLQSPMDRFTSGTNFTRVNWAVDPNYNSNVSYTYATAPGTGDQFKNTTHNAKEYPNENTFDLAHMKQNQTTRVLFKANYVVSGQTTPKTFVEYNGKKFALESGELETGVSAGKDLQLANIIKNDAVRNENENVLSAASTALGISTTLAKVNLYIDGICYYEVRIRHFDYQDLGLENEAAFHLPYENSYVGESGATKEDDSAMLGRYGLVRNNSYVIALNGIAGPGSPTVPTPGDKTDDDPDPYNLNATINVLKWTQRTQGVVLGQ